MKHNLKDKIAWAFAAAGSLTFSAQGADPALEKQLAEIAQKPEPVNHSIGAMCYKIAMLPQSITYDCPVCGGKTSHHDNMNISRTVKALPKLREAFKRWREKGVNMTLDERRLCSECSKKFPGSAADTMKADGAPDYILCLELTHSDSSVHRAGFREGRDVEILEAFFNNSLTVQGDRRNTYSLKSALPRLRELLGIPEKKMPANEK